MQNIIEVNSFKTSSLYFNDESVTYTWNIYIPSGLSVISSGSTLAINFPSVYYRVFKVLSGLNCTILKQNEPSIAYVESCDIVNLKVKFNIIRDLFPDNFYIVTISSLRNPAFLTNPSTFGTLKL